MRWKDHQFRWVRPLHSVIAQLDGALLALEVSLGGSGLNAADATRGKPRTYTVFVDEPIAL